VIDVPLTHRHSKLGRHFAHQLPGRQLLILLFTLKQVRPHGRVDLLVMTKSPIPQGFPTPPPGFILGLELVSPLRAKLNAQFRAQVGQRFSRF
jgi:hypothetical protein